MNTTCNLKNENQTDKDKADATPVTAPAHIPQAAPAAPVKSRGGTVVAWVLAAAVLGGGSLGAVKLWPASAPRDGVAAAINPEMVRAVNIVSAHKAETTTAVNLPAGTQALRETIIYARTNGYITKVLADIGDVVKEGQVLAEIDSPEVDQALEQARANLAKAQANLELSQAMLRRLQSAFKNKAVSQQELDQQQAQTNVDVASVKVAQADVDRLVIQQGYEKVVAPFDGVVTAKNIDPGALITSGSGAQVSNLFKVSDYGTLKVFVDVPQSVSNAVRTGQHVNVTFKEHIGQVFEGTVARLNGELDPTARTRTVEVHLANADRLLLPGEYVQVQFKVTSDTPTLLVPAGVLVIGKEGTEVVVVGKDNRLSYRAVRLGRDFGKETEVLSGIETGEQLVLNPTDALRNGDAVRVHTPEIAAAR